MDTYLAILGPGAPEPILSSDNLTSNCWPITPKEHDLAFVENYEETVSPRSPPRARVSVATADRR